MPTKFRYLDLSSKLQMVSMKELYTFVQMSISLNLELKTRVLEARANLADIVHGT
jgi:hypothetical protein